MANINLLSIKNINIVKTIFISNIKIKKVDKTNIKISKNFLYKKNFAGLKKIKNSKIYNY